MCFQFELLEENTQSLDWYVMVPHVCTLQEEPKSGSSQRVPSHKELSVFEVQRHWQLHVVAPTSNSPNVIRKWLSF